MLSFSTGPATIIDPTGIDYLDQSYTSIGSIRKIQTSEDHQVWLEGEFGKFRLYLLVKHDRPEVVARSIERIGDNHFSAKVYFPSLNQDFKIVFKSPVCNFSHVRSAIYGRTPDSFSFGVSSSEEKAFLCDLTFLMRYALNYPSIELTIKYVGIAESKTREAQHRLGEGHEKLQKLLAENNRRPSSQSVSIVLYRLGEIDPPILLFKDVLRTVESSLIQYFKPTPLNIKGLSFPKDSPKLLKTLIGTGSTSIKVSIESPKGMKLKSNDIPAATVHHISIDLK